MYIFYIVLIKRKKKTQQNYATYETQTWEIYDYYEYYLILTSIKLHTELNATWMTYKVSCFTNVWRKWDEHKHTISISSNSFEIL